MFRRNQHLITFITILTLTCLMAIPGYSQFASSDLRKLNRFVQSTSGSDNETKAFRQGRELIEDEKWQQAEKHFRDFIRSYPNNKNVDAALYWLAFANKKQAHFSEAEEHLLHLVKSYPKSTWVDDAKALRLEIAPRLGNVSLVSQVVEQSFNQDLWPQPVFAPVDFPDVVLSLGDEPFALYTQDTKMDEKDELKAIALQSLMQSNPERALPYITEILKNDSKASKPLKEAALRMLGQYRGPNATSILVDYVRTQTDPRLRRSAIYMLSRAEDDKVYDLLLELATNATDPDVSKAALRALASHRNQKARDMIGTLAGSATSLAVRRDAIYYLGQGRDEASADRLIRLYDAESDPDLKKHIAYSLGQNSSPRAQQKIVEIARSNAAEEIRLQAIQSMGRRSEDNIVDELVKLYQAEKSERIRKQVVHSLSQMVTGHGWQGFAPLAIAGEALRASEDALRDVENRLRVMPVPPAPPAPAQPTAPSPAVRVAPDIRLGRTMSTSKKGNEKALKALLQLYDGENIESLKSQMLYAFSQSSSKDAVQKLIQVARNDSSINLRKKALVYLGQSRDPEASRFLEEVLK